MAFYVDTSAFLKLLVAETESAAMRAWFAAGRDCWSSQLLVTEALRASERLGVDPNAVETVLDAVALILPTAATFHRAGTLAPSELRSLDALHVATADEMGSDLEAVVAYDARVIAAAGAAGMQVLTPL